MDGVMFSADRGDTTEPGRIIQLASLYAQIVRVSESVGSPCGTDSGNAVLRLHDCKGSLTVLWACRVCADTYGGLVDALWGSMGHSETTHVNAEDMTLISGKDTVWQDWIWWHQDDLADMISPSAAVH